MSSRPASARGSTGGLATSGGLVSMARSLGDTRDLQFGLGGLLAVENVYIANGAGSVDYVRPL
jgi:hypothetical protein